MGSMTSYFAIKSLLVDVFVSISNYFNKFPDLFSLQLIYKQQPHFTNKEQERRKLFALFDLDLY